ncbi:MAG: alpha/beta hydrolase [Proteobacteria bacterium]|jgi:pimeloyl-ACP methyl ester carboxylesterase|nr:alpha/beta hydrolase [Pseudomonadota bacterium]MBK8958622.1 alpha/beta hydrolase [Pseudomonadota bacterium]
MYFEVDAQPVFAAGRLQAGAATPPVVLVHGAAMDHTVWVYHTRYFMHVGRSVIAPDLPGHGHSGGTPLASVEAMAAWLLRALDALGVGEVALAGHSMGALVALEAAGMAPERVTRLALLGAAFPMPVSDLLLNAAKANAPESRDMMMIWGHGAAAQYGANPVAGIHIVNTTMRLLEKAQPGLLHTDLKACNDYAHGLEAAAAVKARTTFICGVEDRMTPAPAARQLAAGMANCQVATIAGSGHIMMSEQPELTHRQLVAAVA